MKKIFFLLFALLFIGSSYGQLTGSVAPRFTNDEGSVVVVHNNNGQLQNGPLSPKSSPIFTAPAVANGYSASGRAPGNTYRYQRAIYLLTPTEMTNSGLPTSSVINSIGWSILQGGTGTLTGTLKIYLMNTSNTTFTLSTTWATAISGFTLVCNNTSWSVPINAGEYDVPFTGGSSFTYTGSGLYVAWEFSAPSGTLPTVYQYYNTNTDLTNGIESARSNTSLPTTLAAALHRPITRIGTSSYDDIIALTNIFTTEKIPTGFGTPTDIGVRVNNVSTSAQTFDLTITVKDQATSTTRYTATQTITGMAAGAVSVVNFPGWTPTLPENVYISATTSTIAGETWTANNTVSNQPATVNTNLYGYNYNLTTPGGYGFTVPADAGIFASKFTMHGTGQITGANIFLYNYTTNPGVGTVLYAVVLNSAGTIVTQSDPYTVVSGDLGTNKYFAFPSPAVITDDYFYVGLLLPAATTQVYLLGIKTESYARQNAFYTFGATGGTAYADGNAVKYCIEAYVSSYTGPANPGDFQAQAVSSSQIDLSWSLNGNSDNVLLAWNTTNTFGVPANGTTYSPGNTLPGGNGTVLQYDNSTSFNHAGRSPNTQYFYKAFSYNGSVYSPGVIANATTPCAETPAPWLQDFEGTTFPPTCWAINTGSGQWQRTTTCNGYGGTGACAMADFYNISGTTPFALFTLPFDGSTVVGSTLMFDYAYATYATEVDELDLYYSQDGGATFYFLAAMPGGTGGILNTGGASTTLFVPLDNQWATYATILPAGTNMVAFNAISAFGNNLYVDNIQVVEGLSDDVGVESLDVRSAFPAGSVTPTAWVKNYGGNTETFQVNMTIGAYSSTKTVTGLVQGYDQEVIFDAWNAAAGDYTMTVTTTLAGDLNPANNTLSKPVHVLNMNRQVYGYNAYAGEGTDPEGPTTFNLNNPGVLNSIADQSTQNFVAGGTWANGVWYGAEYNTAIPYNFITINPVTGARTVIGDMGRYIGGLSYNTANGTMYANDATILYTVNMATGATTQVGTANTGINMVNLAINNAGQAYALDLTGDLLGSVNLTTGAFTTIGPIGFDTRYAQDMEFDRETGDLYMAGYSETIGGFLAWVNTTTGAAYYVGPFEGYAEITGLAIPYSTLALDATVTDAFCPSSNDGGIDLTVTGGASPYTYLWSNSETGQDLIEGYPGTYTVLVTDYNGATASGSWTIGYTDPVCNNQWVTGEWSGTSCIDAHYTITIAGSGQTCTVKAPSGHLTLIAAQNILLEPGAKVELGAYLRAYISTTFCGGTPPPLPSVTTDVQEATTGLTHPSFTLFPNPTNGTVILRQNGERISANVKVEIYNMSGSRVMTEQMIGQKQHEFSFSDLPFGMYFVKIVADDYVETIKLIKTR